MQKEKVLCLADSYLRLKIVLVSEVGQKKWYAFSAQKSSLL